MNKISGINGWTQEIERLRAENKKLLLVINDYLSGNICKKSFRENIKKLTAKAGEK